MTFRGRDEEYVNAAHARTPSGRLVRSAILNFAGLVLVENPGGLVDVWFLDPKSWTHRKLKPVHPRRLAEVGAVLVGLSAKFQESGNP